MRFTLFVALMLGMSLALPGRASDPALGGSTGLLVTPTADVQPSGTGAFAWSRHSPGPRVPDSALNYAVLLGFLPGLELGGRVVEDGRLRDLSFNAKYRFDLPGGAVGAAHGRDRAGVAIGGQDIGGGAQKFRAGYVVATVPWETLRFSAGYGAGPDVLKGAFGGVEWRPWPFVALAGEYDTEGLNGGLKLASPELFWGARIGGTALYRGEREEVEYGAHVQFPLGRRERVAAVAPRPSAAADAPAAPSDLRAALTGLGFESIRLGRRDGTTQVAALENRVYNHSSADAVGVAMGALATHVDPAVERIELTLFAYGIPQIEVSAPTALYRAWLADPTAHEAELRAALAARPVSGIEDAQAVAWDGVRSLRPGGAEVVVEPLLRTFVATEYGVFDYALAARARVTTALGRGLLLHIGAHVPVVESEDFGAGRNFEPVGFEAEADLALIQYGFKVLPQWTWLASAGRNQVFRSTYNTVALEQVWQPGDGAHQLRLKIMGLRNSEIGTRKVGLAGYTWFDPANDYSIGLTGGRFFVGDTGVRADLSRHFGDTIWTVFYKLGGREEQAAGMQVSLPLTPRRDAPAGFLQLKGPRRWSHGLGTTLNDPSGLNPLRPFFMYEPMLDLDLRRDFYDSGRLGEAYLRDELPRMREAYERWGR
jgi:hypothetical protein